MGEREGGRGPRRRSYRAGFIPLKKNDLILCDMAKVGGSGERFGADLGKGSTLIWHVHCQNPPNISPHFRGLPSSSPVRRPSLRGGRCFTCLKREGNVGRDVIGRVVSRVLPSVRLVLRHVSTPLAPTYTDTTFSDNLDKVILRVQFINQISLLRVTVWL